MPKLITRVAAVAALLFAGTAAAQAQSQPSPTAYTGPRFPGGPDSLRALLFRSTHQAALGLPGRVLVQFELKDGRQPRNFRILPSPGPLNIALINASATALSYLEAQMPTWLPGTPPLGTKPAQSKNLKYGLVLDFAAPQAAQPYAYADERPLFATLAPAASAANDAPFTGFDLTTQGLMRYVQRQIKYPAQALHQQLQGTVYAYFEVAEDGTLQHPEILGSAGQALNTEVLRAVQLLPAATKPAVFQGKAARIYYILPVTFSIQ
jgi:protein TonB